MRFVLALTAAAVAAGGLLAAPAHATCMPIYDRGDWHAYTCSVQDGPTYTTVCHRPTDVCVSY